MDKLIIFGSLGTFYQCDLSRPFSIDEDGLRVSVTFFDLQCVERVHGYSCDGADSTLVREAMTALLITELNSFAESGNSFIIIDLDAINARAELSS